MNAESRSTIDLLRKMLSLGACNEEQTCACSFHAFVVRTLSNLERERDREIQEGSDRQEAIVQKKMNDDFET